MGSRRRITARQVKWVTSKRWRPRPSTWTIALFLLLALILGLYSPAASWTANVNQARVMAEYARQLPLVEPGPNVQLEIARQYNAGLSSGARLDAQANIPLGTGDDSGQSLQYSHMLRADHSGVMGRVIIPRIDVDLPIYHGTDDDTLFMGAGHLQGTHLPIGGASSHAVITAHSGLPQATMFTRLNELEVGDYFTIEVFGEILSYEVRSTQVVQPEDTEVLHPVEGEDRVTLVTCTPLGINTHRFLATGVRITPTPTSQIQRAEQGTNGPGFPWWVCVGTAGLAAIGGFLVRAGYTDGRRGAALEPKVTR